MGGVALDFKRWTVGLDGEFGLCRLVSDTNVRNLAFSLQLVINSDSVEIYDECWTACIAFGRQAVQHFQSCQVAVTPYSVAEYDY